MEGDFKYIFKLIIIGDCAVGKTSIMNRYADNTFKNYSCSTIGLDFKIKSTIIDEDKVKLHIWDTAGQERFHSVISSYYRGADGIILVYDVANNESFKNLVQWINQLEEKDALRSAEILILGNKAEYDVKSEVSELEILQFCEKYNITRDSFINVSAKDNKNIDGAFAELTKRLIKKSGGYKVISHRKDLKDFKRVNKCC